MLNDRLNHLFNFYDPAIQKLISEVLMLEQAFISMDMERPRWKEPLDQIVTRIARKELEKMDHHKD